jgi:molecular chaperone DnaK
MVKDAEANAAEDKKRREAVDARNQADALIHTTEKTLKELGDKVSASDKAAVEQAVADLKGVLDSGDSAAIHDKSEALTQHAMKLGEALYKSSQAGETGAAPGAPEAAADPGVVDAEFSEVKDDKK